MTHVKINKARLWYVDSGQGAETIVFSHGFLMDHGMFDVQVQSLERAYRCVRFDHRGQGRSETTATGYDLDSLTADAARLIRELHCAPCHFVGLSMGGFVGLRLAIRYPELIRSLTLLETSADPEPKSSRRRYDLMARFAAWFGFRPLLGRIQRLMFGKSFLHDPANRPLVEQWRRRVLAADRPGLLRTAAGVIKRKGVVEHLPHIELPTLIIVGDEDFTTPLALAQRMHEGIRNSRMEVIRGAGHSSSIEQPERVAEVMLEFLSGLETGRQAAGESPIKTRGSAPEV